MKKSSRFTKCLTLKPRSILKRFSGAKLPLSSRSAAAWEKPRQRSLRPILKSIGCEVFVAGVGALSKRIKEMELKNVRIIRHDAVDVIEHMIPPESLDGVHIYFPDPWRKARHHKRRLVAQPFIGKLCTRIRQGGYIHCATDWQNYAEQMLDVLSHEPALQDWKGEGYCPIQGNPLCERPRTKFQARGENLGHGIWDLVYIKR